MNGPCAGMQDRIADYVLGALDPSQADALREHVSECANCRQYLQSLRGQGESLAELGREIAADMPARQDRVIQALQEVEPARPRATRAFPFIGGFIRTAVAAVLLLGAGIAIGRRTAPEPVDVGQLRAELETSIAASLAPAIQAKVLADVDQRLQESLATNNADLTAELIEQVRFDLRSFAAQLASSTETLMSRQYVDLVRLIEAGREKDREQVARALDQLKRRTDHGLYSLATRASETTANMQN
jgi:hypothetical protein